MARIFTAGAELDTTAEFNGGATNNYANAYPVASPRRTGNYSFFMGGGYGGGSYSQLRQLFASSVAEFYLRLAVDFTGSGGFAYLKLAGSAQLTLALDGASHRLVIPQVNITSLAILELGNWYVIEIHDKLSDGVDGNVTLKINGVTDSSFTGKTNFAASPAVDEFTLKVFSGGDCYVDDIAINDTSGAYQNSWIGPGGVYLLRPTGAGSIAEWTPSGAAANWDCVDEVPHNGNTDYVYIDTTGKRDLYAMADLPPQMLSVDVVQPMIWASLSQAGISYIKPVLKLGASVTEDAQMNIVNVQPTYQIFRGSAIYEKPGGGGWTPADVNNLEAGVETV